MKNLSENESCIGARVCGTFSLHCGSKWKRKMLSGKLWFNRHAPSGYKEVTHNSLTWFEGYYYGYERLFVDVVKERVIIKQLFNSDHYTLGLFALRSGNECKQLCPDKTRFCASAREKG